MTINNETLIFTSMALVFVVLKVLSFFIKKKKSAKSIYKLIDELEKKYIY